MRRWRSWISALALALGVGVSTALAAAADPTEEKEKPAQTENVWERFYRRTFVPVPTPGKELPKPVKKVEQPPKETARKKAEKSVKSANLADAAETRREQEEAALLRRLAVCDKLRQVALTTGNEELRRRAEQLDERAWAIYTERTGQLPDASLAAGADEQLLDQRLAIPPAQDRRDGLLRRTTPSQDFGRRAAIKEER